MSEGCKQDALGSEGGFRELVLGAARNSSGQGCRDSGVGGSLPEGGGSGSREAVQRQKEAVHTPPSHPCQQWSNNSLISGRS